MKRHETAGIIGNNQPTLTDPRVCYIFYSFTFRRKN